MSEHELIVWLQRREATRLREKERTRRVLALLAMQRARGYRNQSRRIM